jgi:omega-hydroxy-beta-dihydromenaquinone-9 sulfotransferase
VLKSPGHTARIRLLLEIFPEACFVHMIRDPLVVFQSMRHMIGLMWRMVNLQQPGPDPAEERILRWYSQMYEAFFREVPLIAEGRFHQIRFEDLERDPVGQLRLLYDQLSLSGYEAFCPRLEQYVASLAGYRKNQYPELPPDLRKRVAHVWQRCFEEWAYPR